MPVGGLRHGVMRDSHGRAAVFRRLPCTGKRAEVLVLFVPGNPALLPLYEDFLAAVHATAPDRLAVASLAYTGHDPILPLPLMDAVGLGRAMPKLEDVVKLQLEFLDDLLRELGDVKVVLIGHSVGGWVATQLLKARPDHITALYGLFPTLSHIALSQSGVRITRILNSFVISLTALLCYLIYLFVPFFVLSRVIGAATRIRNPYYRQTVTSFVSTPSCGPAALALATDEMKHIRELDAELLTSYADRVSLYYAERDGWVLDSSRAEVLKLLEGVDKDGKMLSRRMRCKEGIVHAFSLKSSVAMARVCSEWLREDML